MFKCLFKIWRGVKTSSIKHLPADFCPRFITFCFFCCFFWSSFNEKQLAATSMKRRYTHTKKKEEEMLTITNEEQQKWNEANIAAALLSLFLSLVLFLFLFFVVCRCKCGATMATMATLEEPFHFEFDGRHFIHRLLAQVGFPFGSSAEISKDKDQRVDSQKSMRWNVGWRLRHPHRNGENRWVFIKNF